MTDAEYEHQRSRVEACFNHWLWRTRLMGVWRITFHWIRDKTIHETPAGSAFSMVTHFETSADWERLNASVAVYLNTMDDHDDQELSRAVLEEISHILLNEMREWRYYDERVENSTPYVRHEERVAAQFVRSIWALTNESYEAIDAAEAGWPWPLRTVDVAVAE